MSEEIEKKLEELKKEVYYAKHAELSIIDKIDVKVKELEKAINQNKDEKDPKNKDGKDPNAIYDWGSFPLEKNFEWKNQNKDE